MEIVNERLDVTDNGKLNTAASKCGSRVADRDCPINELMTGEDEKTKLVFVYNADSGVFNLLADAAHKIFSPQTYACNLCAITHGNFGMRREWKMFLETLKNSLEFLHADEFSARKHDLKVELPAIFTEENGVLTLKADAGKINECRSIGDLKKIINQQ
ncbi:MAG: hypothetical protein M3033_16905 [Acidobacteriota bacterium]|nr:hypothetical protein [Acidobacteriota bacterium]